MWVAHLTRPASFERAARIAWGMQRHLALARLPGALVPGALVPGAVVLVLPALPGAQRQCQPLVVAALLDGDGLALLASDDLLSRFAQLCPPPRP